MDLVINCANGEDLRELGNLPMQGSIQILLAPTLPGNLARTSPRSYPVYLPDLGARAFWFNPACSNLACPNLAPTLFFAPTLPRPCSGLASVDYQVADLEFGDELTTQFDGDLDLKRLGIITYCQVIQSTH